MYRTDYHTHTPLCLHAEGSPEAFVERALQQGLREYGISDHAPMPDEPFDNWRMKQADMPAYIEWIERAKTAADGTGLIIRAGLECDWVPGIEPWIAHLDSLYDWDYLIGSIHYLGNGWDFDAPERANQSSPDGLHADWDHYWRGYAAMASSGLFQIMGHCDLIRKWGDRPEGDLSPYYEAPLQAIAKAGAVLEINTAGWHKPCKEQYPAMPVLRMAREAGIPLAINSDAHAPEELGRDFDRAILLAREAGYAELASFDKKRIILHPID